MYVFSRDAEVQTNNVLTCMATGFSSRNTIIQIRRDGRVLTTGDGVQSSGILPNGDGTFQQRDHVEIPKSDQSKYTCEVIHDSSGLHLMKDWGKKLFVFFFIKTPKNETHYRVSPEKTRTDKANGFNQIHLN